MSAIRRRRFFMLRTPSTSRRTSSSCTIRRTQVVVARRTAARRLRAERQPRSLRRPAPRRRLVRRRPRPRPRSPEQISDLSEVAQAKTPALPLRLKPNSPNYGLQVWDGIPHVPHPLVGVVSLALDVERSCKPDLLQLAHETLDSHRPLAKRPFPPERTRNVLRWIIPIFCVNRNHILA